MNNWLCFYEQMTKNAAHILAINIRAFRGDLTQMAYARKLGISQATITRIEHEDQNISLKTLQQIAKSLRCEVWQLLKD